MTKTSAAAKHLDTSTPNQIDWRQADDRSLFAGVLAGTTMAWAELLRRFKSQINLGICGVLRKYHRVLPSDARTDITQDFYVYLLENDKHALRVFDTRKGRKLGSWLGLLACQVAIKRVRGVGHHPRTLSIDELVKQDEYAREDDEDADATQGRPDRLTVLW